MKNAMKHQRGVSLSGLLMTCVILVLGAVLGMKVVPAVIEYYTIVKDVKAIAANADASAGAADVRTSFQKRAEIDNISAITSADLDVTKEGDQIVIAFEYEKRIALGGPVSLVIDFKGSSTGKAKGE